MRLHLSVYVKEMCRCHGCTIKGTYIHIEVKLRLSSIKLLKEEGPVLNVSVLPTSMHDLLKIGKTTSTLVCVSADGSAVKTGLSCTHRALQAPGMPPKA